MFNKILGFLETVLQVEHRTSETLYGIWYLDFR